MISLDLTKQSEHFPAFNFEQVQSLKTFTSDGNFMSDLNKMNEIRFYGIFKIRFVTNLIALLYHLEFDWFLNAVTKNQLGAFPRCRGSVFV